MGDLNAKEALLKVMQGGSHQIQDHMNSPDADWEPTFFIVGQDDGVDIIGFNPYMLGSEAAKDLLVTGICLKAREAGAKAIGSILSAWMVEANRSEKLPANLRDHPNRKEVLIITIVEPESVEVWQAKIFRDTVNPPALGEWEKEERSGLMTGRFVEPLREVLKEVKASDSGPG